MTPMKSKALEELLSAATKPYAADDDAAARWAESASPVIPAKSIPPCTAVVGTAGSLLTLADDELCRRDASPLPRAPAGAPSLPGGALLHPSVVATSISSRPVVRAENDSAEVQKMSSWNALASAGAWTNVKTKKEPSRSLRPCPLCEQILEESDFIAHLDCCPSNVQSCPFCFAAVMVGMVEDHALTCSRNTRPCYVCNRQVQLACLAQHLQSCSVGKSLRMFHGTSLQNAKSIMKSGFRPSVKGLLGEGVYLTKDVQKAKAYGPVIVEVEVCLGRVAVINKKGHHLQRCWAAHGYDCAWIPPMCGVVASGLEEHCISDARRIAPLRYFSAVEEKGS